MAQPLELRISLKRGVTGVSETTEAEVCLAFKLGKADSDLCAVVESKFHEVKRALVGALESEDPRLESELATGRSENSQPIPVSTSPEGPDEVPAAVEVTSTEPVPSNKGEEIESKEVESVEDGGASTVKEPSEGTDPAMPPASELSIETLAEAPDRPLLTPAQKRTIRSLCNSLGMDDRQLRTLIETCYNRTKVDDLGRREAGGLLFRLAQKQRERLLRDKPDAGSRHFATGAREETFSRNGAHH